MPENKNLRKSCDAKNQGVFEDRAMRNACDSDSRCGLACDASTRDAKSLAMWGERCEPLRGGAILLRFCGSPGPFFMQQNEPFPP